ncbi:ABC-ATPase domain-containing protein [Radiobacillus kanasensis]|uniref:ABC-ATPase domain-containing protein n=1 Tax=Radiobacillus kanasensis TaxID=2844358 RepID=UPI001E51779D|nr:ABC-ATPase domain-containing protein [Radiobacillus kanasensis]UFU00318.1 ABC-ATPase domain-containing protein [Radiobacillus kanasensis]
MKKLQQLLKQIDGKGYKGYKSIQGKYEFHRYELMIDYVQGDPFASPSKIRIIIPDQYYKIKSEWKKEKKRKIYTEDKIARTVEKAINQNQTFIKGSGKSGMISIDKPGQEILERTAVSIDERQTTICLMVGLPANGRKINGKEAEKLFFTVLPTILKQSVFSIQDEEIEEVVKLADQHKAIREKMQENDWTVFVADGSILPRKSGVSNQPLHDAVPFEVPEDKRVSIDIPHRKEPLSGMALKKGIVLIVGGGYHGKSTLLNAIERGVYHHIKGDGREFVLTDPQAVKVRAEDGRGIRRVNISPFINNLPHGQSTRAFSTENASGSTSQAANVVEALEAGASTILMDEDTSATNFMIRDQRMKELVVDDKEPITPFIDKIKQLKVQRNVSSILVMGGSGDYFDVADDVIMMEDYKPHLVTDKAKKIAKKYPTKFENVAGEFGDLTKRTFLSASFSTGRKGKVQAKGLKSILMERDMLDLNGVEQLVDSSQTRTIAEIFKYLDHSKKSEGLSLEQLLDELEQIMTEKGLQAFTKFPDQHPGDLARPRRFEIAAALNRLRRAKVKDMT